MTAYLIGAVVATRLTWDDEDSRKEEEREG
jgi:hypothetical protein